MRSLGAAGSAGDAMIGMVFKELSQTCATFPGASLRMICEVLKDGSRNAGAWFAKTGTSGARSQDLPEYPMQPELRGAGTIAHTTHMMSGAEFRGCVARPPGGINRHTAAWTPSFGCGATRQNPLWKPDRDRPPGPALHAGRSTSTR